MSFLQSSGGLLGTSQDLLPSDEFKELSLSEKWEKTKNFSIKGSADRSAETKPESKTVAQAVGGSLKASTTSSSKVAEAVHKSLSGEELKKAQAAVDARVKAVTKVSIGEAKAGGGAVTPKYSKEELAAKEAEIRHSQQEKIRAKRTEIDSYLTGLQETKYLTVADFRKFIKDNEMKVEKILSEKFATANQRLQLEFFQKMRLKLPGIERKGELPKSMFNEID